MNPFSGVIAPQFITRGLALLLVGGCLSWTSTGESATAPDSARAALAADGLRCEYRTNPLGIDVKQPRLSWLLQSTQRNQRQTAYQILASRSREALRENRGDLWNSGKVKSDQTIHVPYGGKALRSHLRAFWKVRVWDAQDRASAWSEPGHWQMGLLKSSDWKAQWIAHPATVLAPERFHNGFHSSVARRTDTNQWLLLDLGERRSFDSVRLFPARPFNFEKDLPGFVFPLRFRLETSDAADFTNAHVLVDQTEADVANPGTNVASYAFKPVTARYVRLLVTRLREIKDNTFAFALAEMQVLSRGKNLAREASVSASGSVEMHGWGKSFLVDEDLVSHPGTRPAAQPVTVLRKQFQLPGAVKHATALVSALGLYELRLNGQRVGDQVLAPEWTDYRQRVQYQAYDVTALLRSGDNAIGALLGDGWYAGRVGMSDSLFGMLRGVYGPKPRLLVQLEIELADGRHLRVVSDPSWRATKEGSLRSSDLLDGEVCDARRELSGWDQPDYLENFWEPVEAVDRVTARLVVQPNEPIRVLHDLPAVALSEPKPGVFVFDFGQNMVGRCRLTLNEAAGTAVTLRHAEMTNDDGTIYFANLRGAPQVDRYTARGGATEVFEPTFTQHGFRFVEVTGLRQKPALRSATGRVFYSAAREVGRFECSAPMLNQLWRNILWTQRGNLLSVPTDCPQRDERLGWTGDIQAFSQTAIFNMDLAPFFTKWLRDLRDNQGRDGRYPDFAPHAGNPSASFAGVPAWADAGVIVPWRVYQNYADQRLLAEHFESARRWIDYIHNLNPTLLWRRGRNNDFNDWLNGDRIKQAGWPTNGAEVPKDVFATAFFAHSTELVANMAEVLHRTEDARRYRALQRDIVAAFNREFVQPDAKIKGDTQAGYALALNFNLLPEAQRPAAVAHLLAGIRRYHGHLSTGIQTTHRLMEELACAGHYEVAWQMLTNRAFPSWGYMIENGATTIWERWDGYVKGRGFQDAGMNSFNHWALGAVGEWLWRHVAGINPDDAQPGFKHFRIAPRPGGGVTWAQAEYDSIRGRIATDWRLANGVFHLKLTVPPNTTATVVLPASAGAAIAENGMPLAAAPGVLLQQRGDRETVLRVESGDYSFEVR